MLALPSDSRYSVIGQPQECQSAIKVSHTIWDLKWVLNAADRSNSKRHLCLKTCVSADKNKIFLGYDGAVFLLIKCLMAFYGLPTNPWGGGSLKILPSPHCNMTSCSSNCVFSLPPFSPFSLPPSFCVQILAVLVFTVDQAGVNYHAPPYLVINSLSVRNLI